MKFNSKNVNYNSPKGLLGTFFNPFVKTTKTVIDPEKQRLSITFALQYYKGDQKMTIDENTVIFDSNHQITEIENDAGEQQEIIAFLTAGGEYNDEKITNWGKPSFESVKAYFDLDSVWIDLSFKDTAFKQLAIDWVINNVMIEGRPIAQHFVLE